VSDDNLKEDEVQDAQGQASQNGQDDPPIDADDQTPASDQAAEYLAAWQRERAEFQNFKKRTEKDRAQWQDAIRTDLIMELLPVLDDFARALENLPEEGPARDWANGVLLIQRKLKTQLESLGLEEISTEGQPFNPELHEAVTHETSEKHQPGEIIAVLRKGYKMGDRILRPALVRVAQ
jgi:molecular chaperone GrpE